MNIEDLCLERGTVWRRGFDHWMQGGNSSRMRNWGDNAQYRMDRYGKRQDGVGKHKCRKKGKLLK